MEREKQYNFRFPGWLDVEVDLPRIQNNLFPGYLTTNLWV
jgi:hypothetical protein